MEGTIGTAPPPRTAGGRAGGPAAVSSGADASSGSASSSASGTPAPRAANRRRLSGKQAPPPDGLAGLYEVTRAHVEHIEAFGGVYGKVWVARDAAGQRRWLKQVKSHSWQDGLPEHGVREVAILKDLASAGHMPHVMSVLDVLATREAASQCHRLHIVAEHAAHDLVTYAKAHEFTAGKAQSMARQLTLAVEYIHARGVIHRNLKPASVLVGAGGRLVVSGFETAIRCPPEGAQFTPGGFILRTHIAVRAPELLLGLGRDHPGMDVWALGCCVAFMALGGSVFQPEDNTDEAACREIFHRLGKPGQDHVLAKLPFYNSFHIACRECLGLEDARKVLGGAGLDFLSRLLDLDYCARVCASAALQHPYLASGTRDAESCAGPVVPQAAHHPSCCSSASPPRATVGLLGDAVLRPAADRDGTADPAPPPAQPGREACRTYLLRDQQRERDARRSCAATLWVLHTRLHRIPGLCQHVWGFLFRPRHPQPDYILDLVYIKDWMRAVLIDWLVEVHWKWRLHPAALLLAVDLIDRFLAVSPSLPTHRFQLLGVAALFLAAKVEDEHYDTDMSATTLAWITDRAYTAAEVLDMEVALAKAVGFEAPSWGAYHFLCRFAAARPLPRRHFFAAQCYLEQSLCIYRLSRHTPSLLASACYYLAARLPPEPQESPAAALPAVLPPPAAAQPPPPLPLAKPVEAWPSPRRQPEEGPWPRALEEEVGRSEAEVRICAREVHEAVMRFEGRGSSGKPLVAVRNKFARAVHLHAAELVWRHGSSRWP